MYIFTSIDAQILLGLYCANKNKDMSCLSVISCVANSNPIPTHADFAEAFNKFLYISAIVVDASSVELSNFGADLVHKSQETIGMDATRTELLAVICRQLSVYKLKSMCNRHLWTKEQYEQAVDAYRNNYTQ